MKELRARMARWLVGRDGDAGLVAGAPPVPSVVLVRRFWPYARPYRGWLLLALVFAVLAPAVETATIWLFKLLVDEVLVPLDFGRFPAIAFAYIGLTILGGLVYFCDDYLPAWVGERFILSLRTAFFRHLQTLSLDFFERRRLGDLVARLTGDIESIDTLVLSGVTDAASYGLRIAFFVAALLFLRWELALISLFVAPLFWLVARRFSRLIKRASREKRRRSGAISAVAEESLSNAALVQAYNRQADEVARFEAESRASFAAQVASARLKALFTPLVDVVELAGLLVVMGVGVWEVSRGQLSLGGLLVFMAYLSLLYGPIRGLSRLANTVYAASASAERILELFDERPSVVELPGALALSRARGALAFESVSFRYPGAAREAITDVACELEPGQTLALVGPSGAGKSTVAKLALRFYDPSAGRVLLDGHDLRDLELASLRESVALVLQETLIFDGTIRENIAYGRPGATSREIERAARVADAHDFIAGLPDGYDTLVGQKGRRLSGGERQRIAIARAMIRDAPLLILDEPTTGLDAETSARILEPLRRLMDGRTTIVISHNLLAVRQADTILVMEAGRVTDRGPHAELLARGGTYAGLYRRHHWGATAAPLVSAAVQ